MFASFLEKLEARTAIEDSLNRFARELYYDDAFDDHGEKRAAGWRVAHRTLVFGEMVSEPMREPPGFPPESTLQKHDMDDPLYKVRR